MRESQNNWNSKIKYVEKMFEEWKNTYDIPIEKEFAVKALLNLQWDYQNIPENHYKAKADILNAINLLSNSLNLERNKSIVDWLINLDKKISILEDKCNFNCDNYIDLSFKPSRFNLFLCSPNRSIITKLNEIYNIKHTQKLGDINELEFTVPSIINKNSEITVNHDIYIISEKYIIKLQSDNYIEYYIVNKIEPKSNEEKDVIVVHCKALQYELKDKILRIYNVVNCNLREIMTGILSETTWNIGIIDTIFETKYRAFNFSYITILDAIFQITSVFDALIIWDTVNRKINFYQPNSIGLNRGLVIKTNEK